MRSEVGIFLDIFDDDLLHNFPVCKLCGFEIAEGLCKDGVCNCCKEETRSNILRAAYLKAIETKRQNCSGGSLSGKEGLQSVYDPCY